MLGRCWLVLVLAAAGEAGLGPEAFCDKYLAPNNNATAHGLRWAKELNNFDFAVVEHPKFLYCCAAGASTILWYKDGRPLDMTDEDGFKPFPNRGNDTIYALRVFFYHGGNYTCVASDGHHQLAHNIDLCVDEEKNYHGRPIQTARPHDKYYAEIGGSAEMFCEAFIGFGKDTLDMSQVVWTKVGEENEFASNKRGRTVELTFRYDNQIIGAYLRFYNISAEDFGTYTCRINNDQTDFMLVFNATLRQGEDPNILVRYRATYQNTLIILAVFTTCFVAVVVSTLRWRLEIWLFLKDRFGKLEDDGKEYDIFVCYDADDADFVLGVLVATLEQRFNYRCFAYERDSIAGDLILETYSKRIQASRRFLVVLSPSLACNAWCTYAMYVAVKAMLNLQSKIICVILQNVSWPAGGAGQYDPILQHVLRVVKKVRWETQPHRPLRLNRGTSQDEMLPSPPPCSTGSPRFWTSLRILLPPRRHSIAV